MTNEVHDNPAESRFEMAVGDELATAYYRVMDDRIVLTHTEVPPALSGQGIRSKLAEGTFALIRSSGRRVETRCSFMARWASQHPDVGDLVVNQPSGDGPTQP